MSTPNAATNPTDAFLQQQMAGTSAVNPFNGNAIATETTQGVFDGQLELPAMKPTLAAKAPTRLDYLRDAGIDDQLIQLEDRR